MARLDTRARQGASAASSSHNETRRDRDLGHIRLTATTISFTGPGTIADSNNGLAIFAVGRRIRIRGANQVRNDGEYTVTASAAGSLTVASVNGAGLKTMSAGDSVTIEVVG